MKTKLSGIAVTCVVAVAFGAQPSTPAPTKPPEKPAEQTPPKPTAPPTPSPAPATPPTTMPSLDEALGLAKPTDKPKDVPPPPADSKPQLPGELAKALDGAAAGNELERAVALMEKSAGRLEAAKDTSLETQRVQEETVRLLDALIRKNSQKKNSQNKPQNKPQDQDKNQDQQQPNQSQQSQSEQRQQNSANPNDSPDRGGNGNVRLRPGIDAARAAWGNLPQRVRQLLMQGSGDQFSKEYQRLTEEYYKRLGEGGGGGGN